MGIVMIIFAGVGMVITGGIFGAILIIVGEALVEKWVDKYRFWQFKRKFRV